MPQVVGNSIAILVLSKVVSEGSTELLFADQSTEHLHQSLSLDIDDRSVKQGGDLVRRADRLPDGLDTGERVSGQSVKDIASLEVIHDVILRV